MLACARDGEALIERGGYSYLLPLISLYFNFNYARCCDLAVSYYTKSTDFLKSRNIYFVDLMQAV